MQTLNLHSFSFLRPEDHFGRRTCVDYCSVTHKMHRKFLLKFPSMEQHRCYISSSIPNSICSICSSGDEMIISIPCMMHPWSHINLYIESSVISHKKSRCDQWCNGGLENLKHWQLPLKSNVGNTTSHEFFLLLSGKRTRYFWTSGLPEKGLSAPARTGHLTRKPFWKYPS